MGSPPGPERNRVRAHGIRWPLLASSTAFRRQTANASIESADASSLTLMRLLDPKNYVRSNLSYYTLEPVQILDSFLDHRGIPLHLLRRVPSGAKTIANLFVREWREQLTQPFGIRQRNLFNNILHVRARGIVGNVKHRENKRPAAQKKVYMFWCHLLNEARSTIII